jgi:putative DNA primase/helicase
VASPKSKSKWIRFLINVKLRIFSAFRCVPWKGTVWREPVLNSFGSEDSSDIASVIWPNGFKRALASPHRKELVRSEEQGKHNNMPIDMKERALKLASRKWPVLPMHSARDGVCSCPKGQSCDRPAKHPMTDHGVKDATTDRHQIRTWWTEGPEANIGIAVGREAGILVLDIDPRHGGKDTIEQLKRELGLLPDTVTGLTGGGGHHLIFKHPAFRIRKDTAGKLLGPGIDVLSDGSIMIAPPSRHASGKRYRWEEGKSFRYLEPAALPRRWEERLSRDGSPVDGTDAEGVVREGERNNYLASIAGALQRSGASQKAVSAALVAENEAKCRPPLHNDEVLRIATSIAKYPPERATGERADAAEVLMASVLHNDFAAGKHLRFEADGRFWHFSGKLWQPVPDKWIEGRVLECLEASPLRTGQNTASLMGQVRKLLEAKLATNDDRLSFVSDPPSVINCVNGELWIADDGSVELRPHRPESFLRHYLGVAYDPSAACPEYDRAAREIFGSADNPHGLVRHWHEFVGYVIQPRRHIAVIMILLGGGNNGKTVLIRTVMRLLGPSLVESQRVDNLDKNRFAIGNLFNKLLYVDDDVKAGARLPDGTLKTISEAKEVTGEYKYKSPFNFTVRTVPVLLCNNIPSLADLSYGMRRRLQVVPFDRTFTDEDKDPALFDRIWANELPGVLNRALRGYERLVARGSRFNLPPAVRAATAGWLQQANPLPAFIEDRCVKGAGERCWMQNLYPAYKAWTEQAGYTIAQTQLAFRRNLEHLGHKVSHGNRGQRVEGLALK